MAGIVRKLFKSGGSNKKSLLKQNKFVDDIVDSDEDDYAEVPLGPTTSSATPASSQQFVPTTFQFSTVPLTYETPKLRHDETIDSEREQSFDQPTLKRRRTDPIFDISNEDSVYEHTQHQLLQWEREEKRHELRRKRKRAERHAEQENFVHSAFESIKLEMPTVAEWQQMRKERDQYKREMEKYKRKFEDLEKKYKNLEQESKRQGFQSYMPSYNFFGAPTYQPMFNTAPTFLMQPQQPTSSNIPAPPLNFGSIASLAAPSNPTPLPTSNIFSGLAPSGPMAPRYPDPYDFEVQGDEDTSLSDLSNSSKSDISSDDLK